MYAFKCRSCGNLEDGPNAGEHSVPLACRICGAGCSVDPTTLQQVRDVANWEVLAELPKRELAALLRDRKIDPADIVRHVPLAPDPGNREPTLVERTLADAMTTEESVG